MPAAVRVPEVRSMSRGRSVLLTVVAACVWGCGEGGDDPARGALVLRPGDSLLDHAAAVRVEAYPATNLPEREGEHIGRLLEGHGFVLAAANWIEGPTLPPDSPYRVVVGVAGAVGRWKARVRVGLDLGIGRLWITHEGRPLRRLTQIPGSTGDDSRQMMWHDAEGATLFWWDEGAHALVAFAEHAPGEVAYGVERDGGTGLARFEFSLAGRDPPVDGRDLFFRSVLAAIEAPVFAAPAASVLAIDVDELQADALSFTTSVLDLGFHQAADHVERVSQAGDGVVFAVEVEADGMRRRVWSRQVDPGESWVQQRVDLSAYTGRACTLRLLTEAGFDDDSRFDYALWGGLRLAGDGEAPTRPHLVLVDIDTLRADRLSCYGAERATTPRLDAWAARQAVVFRDAASGNDWTLPATTTMLTGLAVCQHGVTESPRVMTEGMRPVAVRLREAGYETIALTDGGFVAPTFGMSLGFDHFDHRLESDAEHVEHGLREALDLLAGRRSERPVFLFLHSYQVHAPYELDLRFDDERHPYDGPLAGRDVTPGRIDEAAAARGGSLLPEDEEFVRALYDASVRRMDDELGDVLDGLAVIFGDEPYAVIVTSDHGEELFERGTAGHGLGLHSEQLAVPLLLSAPGLAARIDDAPVASIDIVPTLLALAGLPTDARLPGRSLLDPARPAEDVVRYAQHRDTARAMLRGGFKRTVGEVGLGPRARVIDALYDRAADPWERVDRAAALPEVRASLDEALERWLREHPLLDLGGPDASLGDDVTEELSALGYVEDR